MAGKELNVNRLPSVPEVLLKLAAACRRPQVVLDEVVSIIQQDAALTARLINLASAESRLQQIDREGLKELVSLLGMDVVSSMANATAVDQFFSRFWSGTAQHLDLWRRSLECACLTRALARATDYVNPDEAYFAGLLHNIGQWVYLSGYPDEYATVVGGEQSDQEQREYERGFFGQTHYEFAASMTAVWTRDALLSDAILFQEESIEAVLDSPDLVRLLNLSRELMVAEPWEDKSVFEDASRLLGLNAGHLLEIKAQGQAEQREIIESYGYRADEQGALVVTKGVRKALSDHVYDVALLSTINIAAHDDPWQTVIGHFEVLSGVTEVVAFEYDSEAQVLHKGHFGSTVDRHRFDRLQIPVHPGRNLLAEACLMKQVFSTVDDETPVFHSVLHKQLQRIFGKQELLVMPLATADELLGVLVAGFDEGEMEDLLSNRSRLDFFLASIATQLSQHLMMGEGRAAVSESRVRDYIAQTKKLVHEANNPLGVVANYLQILSLKFEQDHETHKQINVIREEIERVAGILATLRGVPDTIGNQRTSVNLNKLLEEIVSVFRVSLFEPNDIGCVLDLDEKIPEIHSLPSHLKQIVTNLLKNSVEALESRGKGSITVETNDAVYFDGRQCIRVVVADNGPGIAPNIMDHLFNSPVSSKGAPHSGVGLMVVQSLVSELGGNILVYSNEKEGARFELFIPRE